MFVLYALLCLETWTTMSPLCCSSNMALKILDYVLTKNMMMQQMAPTEKWAGFFWSSNMMRGKSIPYPLLNCSKCSAWHYMLRPHRRQQNQFLNNNGWRPNPNPSSLTRHTHSVSSPRVASFAALVTIEQITSHMYTSYYWASNIKHCTLDTFKSNTLKWSHECHMAATIGNRHAPSELMTCEI